MLNIYARKPEGTVFKCFTWAHDAESGIARAKREAATLGIAVVSVWAEPQTATVNAGGR